MDGQDLDIGNFLRRKKGGMNVTDRRLPKSSACGSNVTVLLTRAEKGLPLPARTRPVSVRTFWVAYFRPTFGYKTLVFFSTTIHSPRRAHPGASWKSSFDVNRMKPR